MFSSGEAVPPRDCGLQGTPITATTEQALAVIAIKVLGRETTIDFVKQVLYFRGNLVRLDRVPALRRLLTDGTQPGPDLFIKFESWCHQVLAGASETNRLLDLTWQQVQERTHIRLFSWQPPLSVPYPRQAGLHFGLAISDDLHCICVCPHHLDRWGVTLADIWSTAQENNKHLSVHRQPLSIHGETVEVFTGGLCTSGILTCLTQHLRRGPEEVLVATPTATTTILISDEVPQPTLNQVRQSCHLWWSKDPQPLFPSVFRNATNTELSALLSGPQPTQNM